MLITIDDPQSETPLDPAHAEFGRLDVNLRPDGGAVIEMDVYRTPQALADRKQPVGRPVIVTLPLESQQIDGISHVNGTVETDADGDPVQREYDVEGVNAILDRPPTALIDALTAQGIDTDSLVLPTLRQLLGNEIYTAVLTHPTTQHMAPRMEVLDG